MNGISPKRDRDLEEIPWEMIFHGCRVKCEKCINIIRSHVLQQSALQSNTAKRKAPSLSYLQGSNTVWSERTITIVVEAKRMANNPEWLCNHPPDEIYFVEAISTGLRNLLQDP